MNPANTTELHCGILTISASHHGDEDESGTIVRSALSAAGHDVTEQRWIADDLSNTRHLFREWVDIAKLDVIIALGGTGLDSTDVTPEALAPLVSKAMPGFGEIFRMLAFQKLGIHALESRAFAALCQGTLVYLLPGAPEAVSIAVNQLIVPQLGTVAWTGRQRSTMAPAARPTSDVVQLKQYAASGS
jgi:molybdenum cofactor biosynthesis protein B